MGGKGRTTINQPAPQPIDPGESMGEYLFGKGFGNFQGVTDPRLQEKLIRAEEQFRPRYAALELKDIETFALGTGGEREIRAKQAQIDALKQARKTGGSVDVNKQVSDILGPAPAKTIKKRGSGKGWRYSYVTNPEYTRYQQRKKDLTASLGVGGRADLDAKIAMAESDLRSLKEQGGTRGLFSLMEEAGEKASAMQRESLAAQRADDVSALQEFAPQVVEAYRAADPYSTALAEQTQRRALGQLTPDEERDVQQQARQAAMARGRTGASAEFQEVLGRRQFTDQYTQPAFQMNRALAGDIGSTILGRPSAGLAMGGGLLGQAQGLAAGPMGPQLFDPNVGINMAMQQRSQDMNLMGAQAQAQAAQRAGRSSMLGSIAGAFIGGPAGLASSIFK